MLPATGQLRQADLAARQHRQFAMERRGRLDSPNSAARHEKRRQRRASRQRQRPRYSNSIRRTPSSIRAIDRWLGPVDRNTGIVDEVGSSRRLIHGDRCGEDRLRAVPWRSARRRGRPLATAGRGAARASKVGSARRPMPVTGVTDQTIATIVYKFSTQYLVRCPWHDTWRSWRDAVRPPRAARSCRRPTS